MTITSVSARTAGRIAAPIDTVWAYLSDIDHWSDWNPAVRSAWLLGPARAGTEFHWSAAGLRIRSRLTRLLPPTRISWTGRAPGLRARHDWVLRPAGRETYVETEEMFEGFIPRLLPELSERMLRRGLDQGLDALRTVAEANPDHILPPARRRA